MHLLMGSLLLPAGALLTCLVDTNNAKCAHMCVCSRCVRETHRLDLWHWPLLHLCFFCFIPSVRLSNQLSPSLSLCLCVCPCPLPSSPGRVIHSSNNWRGCRLPSNTGILKDFQISEAYGYLLFSLCLCVSLIAGALLFAAQITLLKIPHHLDNDRGRWCYRAYIYMYVCVCLHRGLMVDSSSSLWIRFHSGTLASAELKWSNAALTSMIFFWLSKVLRFFSPETTDLCLSILHFSSYSIIDAAIPCLGLIELVINRFMVTLHTKWMCVCVCVCVCLCVCEWGRKWNVRVATDSDCGLLSPVNGSKRDKELLCLHGNQRAKMVRGQRGVKTRKL